MKYNNLIAAFVFLTFSLCWNGVSRASEVLHLPVTNQEIPYDSALHISLPAKGAFTCISTGYIYISYVAKGQNKRVGLPSMLSVLFELRDPAKGEGVPPPWMTYIVDANSTMEVGYARLPSSEEPSLARLTCN